MNLRDYFAGQALAGMSSLYEVHHDAGETEVANWAYQQADAMLAVRNACPEQLPTRGEIAVAAMQGLLSGGVRADFEPDYVAATALQCADAMLAELQSNPVAVAEAQQMQAGIHQEANQ
jgi:hypothetical protein